VPGLELTAEQEMIRASARRFLADACPPSLVRASYAGPQPAVDALWTEMAQLSWTGLIVPENHGGTGAAFRSLIVLLEEMGRVCLPGPFFSTVVLGGLCLTELAAEAHKAALLPRLAQGELRLTLAVQEGASEFDRAALAFEARPDGDLLRLTGCKTLVPDAQTADYVLCVAPVPAHHEAYDLLLLPPSAPGVDCRALHTIAARSFCELICADVRLGRDAVLNATPVRWRDLQRLLCKAAVAKSAEMIGGAQRVLDIALDHAKKRRQFGRVIGAFQAVQHHCVNMLTMVESSRWLTYRSAAAIDRGEMSVSQAAMTKVWANQAYREVVRLGHQVMGGIGYIEEHELPLFSRHLRQNEAMLGDSDTLLDVVAAELLATGE